MCLFVNRMLLDSKDCVGVLFVFLARFPGVINFIFLMLNPFFFCVFSNAMYFGRYLLVTVIPK